MALDIQVNCQLSKQENRWPVPSHDHIGDSDVVSDHEDVYQTTELRKMAPNENLQIKLGQHMHDADHAAYIFEIWYKRYI